MIHSWGRLRSSSPSLFRFLACGAGARRRLVPSSALVAHGGCCWLVVFITLSLLGMGGVMVDGRDRGPCGHWTYVWMIGYFWMWLTVFVAQCICIELRLSLSLRVRETISSLLICIPIHILGLDKSSIIQSHDNYYLAFILILLFEQGAPGVSCTCLTELAVILSL